MTCREIAAFLDRYVSGELPAHVHAAFEDHLEICVNCLRYLQHYRLSIALGQQAFASPDAEAPQDVPEDLIRAIAEAFRLKAEATEQIQAPATKQV